MTLCHWACVTTAHSVISDATARPAHTLGAGILTGSWRVRGVAASGRGGISSSPRLCPSFTKRADAGCGSEGADAPPAGCCVWL